MQNQLDLNKIDNIIHCYDAKDYADRYTIVMLNKPIRMTQSGMLYESLGASCYPFHPMGIGQHVESLDGTHLGVKIKFKDLPNDVQKFVLQDLS